MKKCALILFIGGRIAWRQCYNGWSEEIFWTIWGSCFCKLWLQIWWYSWLSKADCGYQQTTKEIVGEQKIKKIENKTKSYKKNKVSEITLVWYYKKTLNPKIRFGGILIISKN